MPLLSSLQHLGVAKETVWGTGVVPAKYIPVTKVKPLDLRENVKDEAKRGVPSKTFGVIQTTQKGTIDIDTYLYCDEIGYFLLNLLGKDVVTGTGPYNHKFSLDATPTGTKSLSLQHFDGLNERQFAGAVIDEVKIKGDAAGIITVSVKVQGKLGVVVGTTTASIAPGLKPLVGANASLTVDTIANTNLFGFDITIKRDNRLVFGANTSPAPTKAVQGVVEVSGKLTFDIEDTTEYGKFDGGTHAIVLTLGGVATANAKITIPQLVVDKSSRDDGQSNLRVDWDFTAIYDVATTTPITVELNNSTVAY
jgi:Phage tail tube protein